MLIFAFIAAALALTPQTASGSTVVQDQSASTQQPTVEAPAAPAPAAGNSRGRVCGAEAIVGSRMVPRRCARQRQEPPAAPQPRAAQPAGA